MANRRMFSLDVCDTDAFLDLPASSQNLYFHLGLRADDDGFVSSPRKITAMVNCSGDDLKLLVAKGFIIPFDNGICVIRDWRTNNYIRSDRYKETRYLEEKSRLSVGENGAYQLADAAAGLPSGIPTVNRVGDGRDTQYRLGKDRLGKDSLESAGLPAADKPPSPRFVPPTVEEVAAYCTEKGYTIDPAAFVDYYTANGWVQGRGKPLKDWRAAVRNWARRDAEHTEKQGVNFGDFLG